VSETIVRPAVDADLPSLIDLYNHYVLNTPVTFDTTVEASVCCRATESGKASAWRSRT